jgi:hypothetical protein
MVNSFPGYLSLKLQAEGLKTKKIMRPGLALAQQDLLNPAVPKSEQAPDTNALTPAPG